MSIAVFTKRLFHSLKYLFMLLFCLPLFFPNAALATSETVPMKETDAQEIGASDSAFLNQSKEEFLSDLLKLSKDASNSEDLLYAGYALQKRTDFTHKDYLSLIIDSNNPLALRHLAMECYAEKIPVSGIDDALITLISDSKAPSSLRTIAIALLGKHFDAQNETHRSALLSAAKSKEEGLAYNAIKALEQIWPKDAVALARDIYHDFKNESSARINIACKILTRYYSSPHFHKANDESVHRFIRQSLEIYNTIDDNEIKSVIPQALESLPDIYNKRF